MPGRTHGESGTRGSRLYRAWTRMRRRCNNPNHDTYQSYGGRGIRVDPAWDNYPVFRDYVLKHLGELSAGASIDRKDNDKDYEPGNIRFATPKAQARNRRSNRHLTHPATGETRLLCEWAERLHLTPAALCRRLAVWSIERALSTPADPTAGRFRSKAELRRRRRFHHVRSEARPTDN